MKPCRGNLSEEDPMENKLNFGLVSLGLQLARDGSRLRHVVTRGGTWWNHGLQKRRRPGDLINGDGFRFDGLEPWNFITFHILGIVTPTGSEGLQPPTSDWSTHVMVRFNMRSAESLLWASRCQQVVHKHMK